MNKPTLEERIEAYKALGHQPDDYGLDCTTAAVLIDDLIAEREKMKRHLELIQSVVDQQADDEGLWAIYPIGKQPIGEAYLQQELRRLHAAIEDVVWT